MNEEISSSIYGTCFGFGYAIIYSVSSFQKVITIVEIGLQILGLI